MRKKWLLLSFVLLLCIFMPAFVLATEKSFLDNNSHTNHYNIESSPSMFEILHITLGSGEHEVGYIKPALEVLDRGPTSFFVKGDTYYILDNVNKKILIHQSESIRPIKIDEVVWAKDIVVSDDGTIYVLDSSEKIVIQYDVNGNILSRNKIPDDVVVPLELAITAEQQIAVKDAGKGFTVLSGGVSPQGLFQENGPDYLPDIVNDKSGVINIGNSMTGYLEDKQVFIPYQHSFGGLKLHDISDQGFVITKTEVAPDVPVIVAESHIELLTLEGVRQAGMRIPTENMIFIPDRMVHTDNGNIYLFSIEDDGIHIYKVTLGKNHESLMEQKVKERMNKLDNELKMYEQNEQKLNHKEIPAQIEVFIVSQLQIEPPI